jgi:hypothetical protein
VLGLGTAWVLDGLSITIASSVSSKLTQRAWPGSGSVVAAIRAGGHFDRGSGR